MGKTCSTRMGLSASLMMMLLWAASAPTSAAPEYAPNVAGWIEIEVPADSDAADRAVWSYAANYSNDEWSVGSDGGQVRGTLIGKKDRLHGPRPEFVPAAERFHGASAFAQVEDGWLVGFNQGEFGAALYWFSRDGKSSYRISDHQVVDFIRRGDTLYAIEGLAHLGLSRGSLIGISQSGPLQHWQARSEATLPFAPYAVSALKDGTFLIVLSDALVAVDSNHLVHTLLANAPWNGLYPNSSALSDDQSLLYVGMRQYVGQYDLGSRKLRLLVPSREFLNTLSEQQIRRIRMPFERAAQSRDKID